MNIDRRAFMVGAAAAVTAGLGGCGGGADEVSLPPMTSRAGASAASGGVEFVVDSFRHVLWITGADGVKRKVGGLGTALGRLNFPFDVAVLGGLAYVVETGNHRVQRFDAGGVSQGSFGEDVLLYPGGIEVRGAEIFVADSRNGRIAVFDAQGRLLRTFGEGLLSAPRGLAAYGKDLLVADPGLRKVLRLNAEGRLVAELGGDWVLPWHVATDGQAVYVSDASAAAVAVVEPDGPGVHRVQVQKAPVSLKLRKGTLYVA